ncbi:DapH/DapD/GlmU-related protein [Parahaliea maris]
MGPRCTLVCNTHHFSVQGSEWVDSPSSKPIVIGDECFIATGATILGGVSIGSRSIVAAGAVVTEDVPPNSFVAGVPATVKRTTTPDRHHSNYKNCEENASSG